MTDLFCPRCDRNTSQEKYMRPHAGKEREYAKCSACSSSRVLPIESIENLTMYFGKHKGIKLKDVPEDYLKWSISKLGPLQSNKRYRSAIESILKSDETLV